MLRLYAMTTAAPHERPPQPDCFKVCARGRGREREFSSVRILEKIEDSSAIGNWRRPSSSELLPGGKWVSDSRL